MTFKIGAGAVAITSLVTLCLGYGGFEVTGSFVGVKGLNQALTALNQSEWCGSDTFAQTSPLWWLGGHGGGQVGIVTFGGSGAISARASHADSLGSELVALRGDFEAGYPYAPAEWFWVRPCVDVGLAAWLVYVHSVEGGTFVGGSQPNFSRYFSAWTLGAAPGVEVMGRLPSSPESFIGLFAKASYFIPVAGPEWFGDIQPPEFGLSGFAVQVGLRFGRTAYRAFRI
ncbi:MAG: hypothetical protein NTX53_11990 [candidate division WOR-3 bacterium]|nr:hypothetical protein [candidate division WOR-3 bacterium]